MLKFQCLFRGSLYKSKVSLSYKILFLRLKNECIFGVKMIEKSEVRRK